MSSWKDNERGHPAWRAIAAPNDGQAQTAGGSFPDENSTFNNTDTEITEVLHGN